MRVSNRTVSTDADGGAGHGDHLIEQALALGQGPGELLGLDTDDVGHHRGALTQFRVGVAPDLRDLFGKRRHVLRPQPE
jgi:hypothetical protein